MIARFWYADRPSADDIAFRLAWLDGEAMARVEAPTRVAEMLADDVPFRANDEFMSLAFALGYAVLIAGLSETTLTVTGDITAWPQKWGALQERPKQQRPVH